MHDYSPNFRNNSHGNQRGGSNGGGQGGKPRAPRTALGLNLKELVRKLEFDMVVSAIGLPDTVLRNILDGRLHSLDTNSRAQLEHRFFELGIPANWLDLPNTKIPPEYLTKLVKRAAEANNKLPIRRRNFKKIVDAFPGRLTLLSDALEMLETSLIHVADGQLDLDDSRFGHLNARLFSAGFPDGWLELADTTVTPEMIAALEAQAVDAYERDLFEDDEVPNAVVVAAPPVAASTQEEPVTETPAAAAQLAENPSTKMKEPVMAKQPTAAIPPFAKDPTLTTAPLPHPMSKLPASVARTVAAKPEAAKRGPKKRKESTPRAEAVPASSAATPAAATPVAAPAAAASVAETAKKSRGSVSKEVSAARAEALNALFASARRGVKATLWGHLMGSSLSFWGNISRGNVLFRDDLARGVEAALELPNGWLDSPSLPPATLAAWFTDESVPLPGKAAQSSAEPETASSTARKPVGRAYGNRGSAPAPDATTAAAATAEAATATPAATLSKPPFAVSTQPAAPSTATQAEPVAAAPATTPAGDSTPSAAAAPAPVAVQPAVIPTVELTGFAWSPAAAPVAVAAPGPITQAVGSVLNKLAMEGRFTEDDAMRLLQFVMSQR